MRVCVIGSTGSIGTQALDVIEKAGFEVVALSAGRNIELLRKQIKKFKPKFVCVEREEDVREITGHVEVFWGEEGLVKIAGVDSDVVVLGISGFASLEPAIKTLERGGKLVIASKEAIICGGKILKKLERKRGGEVIPVDSEHSALFRLMKLAEFPIRRYIIVASGGPFLAKPLEEMEKVTPDNALRHPIWSMGRKITVDSATLMNKAFEVIEAFYLFDIPPDRIEVVVHPSSLFHAFVELEDGVLLALAHLPDMRIPIAYALGCKLNFRSPTLSGTFSFEAPDFNKFPALRLGWEVLEMGGTASCALVSADEVAVSAFLQGRIKITDIYRVVKETIGRVKIKDDEKIENIRETYFEGRKIAERICSGGS